MVSCMASMVSYDVAQTTGAGVVTRRALGPIAPKILARPTKCSDQGPKWPLKYWLISIPYAQKISEKPNLALKKGYQSKRILSTRGFCVHSQIYDFEVEHVV